MLHKFLSSMPVFSFARPNLVPVRMFSKKPLVVGSDLVPKQNPKFVLGLDINTNSTGYALIENNGYIRACGAFDSSQCKDKISTCQLENAIKELYDAKIKPNLTEGDRVVIAIEDFMRSFGGPSWRTTDIMKLAQLNSLVSYNSYKLFGIKPIHVHPMRYRTFFGLKARVVNGKSNIKQLSMEHIEKMLPQFPWLKKRTGAISELNYDVCDAMLIALSAPKFWKESFLEADSTLAEAFAGQYSPRKSLLPVSLAKQKSKLRKKFVEEIRKASDVVHPAGSNPVGELKLACEPVWHSRDNDETDSSESKPKTRKSKTKKPAVEDEAIKAGHASIKAKI